MLTSPLSAAVSNHTTSSGTKTFSQRAAEHLTGCNRTPGTEGDFAIKRWCYEPRDDKASKGVRTLEDLVPAFLAVSAPDDSPDLCGDEPLDVILKIRCLIKMVSQSSDSDDIPVTVNREGPDRSTTRFLISNNHKVSLPAEMRSALDLEGKRGLSTSNRPKLWTSDPPRPRRMPYARCRREHALHISSPSTAEGTDTTSSGIPHSRQAPSL